MTPVDAIDEAESPPEKRPLAERIAASRLAYIDIKADHAKALDDVTAALKALAHAQAALEAAEVAHGAARRSMRAAREAILDLATEGLDD